MSTSALESEDLENVPLVRMEDVQPSRTYDLISHESSDEEVLETCVVDDIEYDNECIVNDDDDSNIGSMVSLQSEDIIDDDSEAEMIVPEPLEPPEAGVKSGKKPPPSWPTLEILPGGVIKKPQKSDDVPDECPSTIDENKAEKMMYACAKCSQRFKFLFCLVKHVKWHEDEAKRQHHAQVKQVTGQEEQDTSVQSNKRKMVIGVKSNKKKSPKKLKS